MKTTQIVMFIWLVISLPACNDKGPETTLQREELKAILWDLHVARAATYGMPAVQKDSLMDIYKDQISEIHQIKREELEQNLEALRDNQILLSNLLQEIEAEIMQD